MIKSITIKNNRDQLTFKIICRKNGQIDMTMVECIKDWREDYEILIEEFEAKDIAAIPTATDGKFRVHKCTINGSIQNE